MLQTSNLEGAHTESQYAARLDYVRMLRPELYIRVPDVACAEMARLVTEDFKKQNGFSWLHEECDIRFRRTQTAARISLLLLMPCLSLSNHLLRKIDRNNFHKMRHESRRTDAITTAEIEICTIRKYSVLRCRITITFMASLLLRYHH